MIPAWAITWNFFERFGMKISIHPDSGALCLAGALEIYEAESVRQAFVDWLARGSDLVLDLGEVGSCDTAGAQLLCAARQAAVERGKTVRFERVPTNIRENWLSLGLPEEIFPAATA